MRALKLQLVLAPPSVLLAKLKLWHHGHRGQLLVLVPHE